MKRAAVNLVLDLIALVLVLGTVATAYILWFPLPPGTNKTYVLWGITRHEWGTGHFWCGACLLGSVAVHLVLHWKWIVGALAQRLQLPPGKSGSHVRSGLVTLAIAASAFAAFAWAAHFGVSEITESGIGRDPRPATRHRPRPGEASPDTDSGRSASHAAPASGAATIQAPGNGGAAEGSAANEAAANETRDSAASWQTVQVIFARACVGCHGPAVQRGGFRADQREGFFGSDRREPIVVPGKSEASPLVDLISGRLSDVPLPGRHRLPEPEVARVRAWINAGAPWPAQEKVDGDR